MPDKIGFKEWGKIDLRAGKILKAEDVEESNKLFKLEVNVGEDNNRTLVAALKPYYSKSDLESKRCIVLCNLDAKILKGIKSKGMILAAVNEDKSEVKLLQPDEEIDLGSNVQ